MGSDELMLQVLTPHRLERRQEDMLLLVAALPMRLLSPHRTKLVWADNGYPIRHDPRPPRRKYLTDDERREYNRKRSKAYYQAHREKLIAYYKAYHETHRRVGVKPYKTRSKCSPFSEPASRVASSRFLELLAQEKKSSCRPSMTA